MASGHCPNMYVDGMRCGIKEPTLRSASRLTTVTGSWGGADGKVSDELLVRLGSGKAPNGLGDEGTGSWND